MTNGRANESAKVTARCDDSRLRTSLACRFWLERDLLALIIILLPENEREGNNE